MKADSGRLHRALASPPDDIRLYLFHGPDEAGAIAAAAQLAGAFGRRERVDLDGATLRKDPGRLLDEAVSLSLFGEQRLIRITGVGEESVDAISLLLDNGRDGHPVIALAPGARSTSRLVKLGIASPRALVHAFYEPSAADLERSTIALARDRGLVADAGVARRIVAAASSDQLVIASELDKLALFLDADTDRLRPLNHDALDRIGADLGDAALDDITRALIDGAPGVLGQALERMGVAGASPVAWLRAAGRRLLSLAAMRSEIDAGAGVDETMKRHRVFFRDEAPTRAALRHWSSPMIARGLTRLRDAERATMAPGNAGSVIADATALELARGVASRR